jgi:hypothetical protein
VLYKVLVADGALETKCDYVRFWSPASSSAEFHHHALRTVAQHLKESGKVPYLQRIRLWTDGHPSTYKGFPNFGRTGLKADLLERLKIAVRAEDGAQRQWRVISVNGNEITGKASFLEAVGSSRSSGVEVKVLMIEVVFISHFSPFFYITQSNWASRCHQVLKTHKGSKSFTASLSPTMHLVARTMLGKGLASQ